MFSHDDTSHFEIEFTTSGMGMTDNCLDEVRTWPICSQELRKEF